MSWGPDDGKSILKRCRQRDGDERETSRQRGHGQVDIRKSISQAGKKTDQKYISCKHIGMPAIGHEGRHVDPFLALRYP